MSSIIEHFSNLCDPRTKEHKKEHKLIDILLITIAAVICAAEDWNDIEFYGQEKEDWLKTIQNCLAAFHRMIRSTGYFRSLPPAELQSCFIGWVQCIAKISEGQVISIDGNGCATAANRARKPSSTW